MSTQRMETLMQEHISKYVRSVGNKPAAEKMIQLGWRWLPAFDAKDIAQQTIKAATLDGTLPAVEKDKPVPSTARGKPLSPETQWLRDNKDSLVAGSSFVVPADKLKRYKNALSNMGYGGPARFQEDGTWRIWITKVPA